MERRLVFVARTFNYMYLAYTSLWTCSFGWCLAEGYGNGDQRRRMGPCGSGMTLWRYL